ncbi:MAG: hypothetical protein NTZ46_07625 [Verrucomicrobia bacterium]|nr:hypothetical protein [Verrucomicrobiota bacterium]
MKNLFLWLAIGVMAYFGWSFYRNQQKQTALPTAIESPTPTTTPALPPPSSSTPIAIQTQPTPVVAPVKRLTPGGIFFVLQRLSTMTDSGVASVVPGAKVTLVRAGSPMRVSDGQHEYDAFPAQLTNDMDIAEKIASADCLTQSALKQQIFRTTQVYHEQRTQALKTEDVSREKTAEKSSNAEAARQKLIAWRCQQIKDARQAILDYRPIRHNGRITINGQHAQQRFIDQKQAEIRGFQNELVKLGVSATFE